MRISFVISKLENKFFFMSNLTNWHFSCRPDYNFEWLKKRKLSPDELEVLKSFKAVLLNHGYEYHNGKNEYLGQAFYIPKEERKWKQVKKFVNSEEYVALKKTFVKFEKRFDGIWDMKKIQSWKNALERELKKESVKKFFLDIAVFYGVTLPKNLTVHLIASPSYRRSPAGSANIGPHDVVLEVPVFRLDQWNIEMGLAILAHELIHILVDGDRKMIQIIKRELRNHHLPLDKKTVFGRTHWELTKELLGELYAPFGYPSYKAFNSFKPISDIVLPNITRSNKNNSLYDLIQRVVWSMYPEVGNYFEDGKKIDTSLITHIFDKLS